MALRVLFSFLLFISSQLLAASPPNNLMVMHEDNYPKALFFRDSEKIGRSKNSGLSYGRWEDNYSQLMGIIGKVLNNELPTITPRGSEAFKRFKKEHPEKLVMNHYNGNARDPRHERDKYFAGHWLYYNGAKITSDVEAEQGISVISVDQPLLFKENIGLYNNVNEDIGLCILDENGMPDWHNAEQVKLLSVDVVSKTITVKRAQYGTKPLTFAAGRAYAAAHMHTGPWGKGANLLWRYNHSVDSPRDTSGKRTIDVRVEEIKSQFAPGGRLHGFDGLEFDVLLHTPSKIINGRGADCNADGVIDNCIIEDRQVYGIGVVEFMRMLRGELGSDKLILGDGHSGRHNRAFFINNGIESEGWPDLRDHAITDWSGGMNRHYFWQQNGHKPTLNYIAHKFQLEKRGGHIPFSTHRLVFSAGVFTDSAIAPGLQPKQDGSSKKTVWDEFVMGVKSEPGWLGKPKGPAVHLFEGSPDLLNGELTGMTNESLKRIKPDEDTLCSIANNSLVCKANNRDISFVVEGVPVDSDNLTLRLRVTGAPMAGYPVEVARLMEVELSKAGESLITRNTPWAGVGTHIAGEVEGIPETSGAKIRYRNATIGNISKPSYMVHPPGKRNKGYTWFKRDVFVPVDGILDFYTAMGKRSLTKGDGVWFSIQVLDDSKDGVEKNTEVFEHSQQKNQWVHHTVSLKEYSGKKVTLKFIADSGPYGNSIADQSFWGAVQVRGRNAQSIGKEGVERYKYMSYVNSVPFTSRFFYPKVNRKSADVRVTIEGGEPVTIEALSVHAMPDVVYREFENGIVLANPGLTPFTFNLDEIAPGRKFRRIQATKMQDVRVNNGGQVAGTLTLEAKDALFLSSE